MRPKGTKLQLEIRRRVAMTLLDTGWGIRQVARQVKASPGSICRWRDARDHYGEAGLNAKRHPGGTSRLTEAQRARLLTLLRQGARAHGFRNELWTLRRIAALIQRHFGISYCPSGVWRVLRRLKWSPQKPTRRGRERHEEAIAHWPTDVWPQLKKSPA
jgi:transposase